MDPKDLISIEGIKLGNYHYDIDRYVNEAGEVELYLTRYYEECRDCALFDDGCFGDDPPVDYEKYPCANMLPIEPYSSGYDFCDGIDDLDDYSEFTDIEKEALKLIWEDKY